MMPQTMAIRSRFIGRFFPVRVNWIGRQKRRAGRTAVFKRRGRSLQLRADAGASGAAARRHAGHQPAKPDQPLAERESRDVMARMLKTKPLRQFDRLARRWSAAPAAHQRGVSRCAHSRPGR